MILLKPDRPYFETWLRRTGRQLAASGRLTQTAVMLAREDGGCAEQWRRRLRALLDGSEAPTLDLLTRIDKLLSGLPPQKNDGGSQGTLF